MRQAGFQSTFILSLQYMNSIWCRLTQTTLHKSSAVGGHLCSRPPYKTCCVQQACRHHQHWSQWAAALQSLPVPAALGGHQFLLARLPGCAHASSAERLCCACIARLCPTPALISQVPLQPVRPASSGSSSAHLRRCAAALRHAPATAVLSRCGAPASRTGMAALKASHPAAGPVTQMSLEPCPPPAACRRGSAAECCWAALPQMQPPRWGRPLTELASRQAPAAWHSLLRPPLLALGGVQTCFIDE